MEVSVDPFLVVVGGGEINSKVGFRGLHNLRPYTRIPTLKQPDHWARGVSRVAVDPSHAPIGWVEVRGEYSEVVVGESRD